MTYQQILDLITTNLASGSKIPAVKHREVETALLDFVQQNIPKRGDIKAIFCDSTYLGNNFDNTGLGKLERLGDAICNGNNGTPNLSGRMIVSYGGDFTVLNEEGGSKTHTLSQTELPAHTHTFRQYVQSGSNSGSGGEAAGYFEDGQTQSTGNNQPHNNMPPYKVLVYIMKL